MLPVCADSSRRGKDATQASDSTALAERLGAIEMKSFLGKFLFDISAPITNNGGDIYLYKGDGLIALWP